jgi:hypothetical protein
MIRRCAGLLSACVFATLLCTVVALSVCSPVEQEAVRKQLGYLPPNFICVSAWKGNSNDNSNGNGCGEPVAIKTYPLNGGARRRQAKAAIEQLPIGTPFPTLYWLTCPEISRVVAEFERKGYVRLFQERLNADPLLANRLIQCHEEYANERWESLTPEDRSLLMSDDTSVKRMRNMMQCSGISGTNFTAAQDQDQDGDHGDSSKPVVASIKCLHAHYAHYRSTMLLSHATPNPVGEMIHTQLQEEFPALIL